MGIGGGGTSGGSESGSRLKVPLPEPLKICGGIGQEKESLKCTQTVQGESFSTTMYRIKVNLTI